MKQKQYMIKKGTLCIAYRRITDEYGSPSVESKQYTLNHDTTFDQPVLTPHQYIENPHKYPGNSYSVQLATKGYIIFSTVGRASKNKIYIAVSEDDVEMVEKEN